MCVFNFQVLTDMGVFYWLWNKPNYKLHFILILAIMKKKDVTVSHTFHLWVHILDGGI